jgi:hypothetical protein
LRCSCGALLPEDARFCHKCGKPQYEEDIERISAFEEAQQPTPPAPPIAQPQAAPRVGFSNGRAVRITLAVAAFSLLAIAIIASVAPPLLVPILVAAGFTSVRIYVSRTSERLTPSGAAFLGAMPWLWLSVPLSILEAISVGFVVFTAQGKEIVKTLKNPEVIQLMNDPAKLVAGLLLTLLVGTVSGALGGILAARWQPRNGPSH